MLSACMLNNLKTFSVTKLLESLTVTFALLMLFFLSIAQQRGFVVDSYRDDALGVLGKNGDGKMAMTRITLAPAIVFGGERQPTAAELDAIHHSAHDKCYIANSIKTEILMQKAS